MERSKETVKEGKWREEKKIKREMLRRKIENGERSPKKRSHGGKKDVNSWFFKVIFDFSYLHGVYVCNRI